jgi:hypothetical protein
VRSGGGLLVWLYTLLLPSFAKSGWLPIIFLRDGMFGIELLRPQQLFGLTARRDHALPVLEPAANIGCYIGVSLASKPGAAEHSQATLFVDALKAAVAAGIALLARQRVGAASSPTCSAAFSDPTARRSAGAVCIGTLERGARTAPADCRPRAPRRIVCWPALSAARRPASWSLRSSRRSRSSSTKCCEIIDEASQALAHSRELEQKSRELEAATNELRGCQPAPAGARPAQGRFHFYRDPRAAHTAHVDTRVQRNTS